jgi:hypothetical protein
MSTLVKITVNQNTDLVSVKVFQAENGAQGDRAGLKYTFSTSTNPGAPSPGYLKFNSATLSAVTQIAIRDTDFDGADTTALLALIDDSTSTMKARVLIRSNSNSDTSNFNFLVTSVTDEGNHFHINGTYVSGSAFADNEVVTFDFYITGDLGATGPAPSGTGFVKVVSGVLQTPSASIAQADVTNLTSDLALKAPLISPSFTTPSLGVATATSITSSGSINVTGGGSSISVSGNGGRIAATGTNGEVSTSGTFNVVGSGGSILYISSNPSTNRFVTIPNADGTIALTANKLSAFAATTSAELKGVISDETGSGSLVFGTSPTIDAPTISGAAAFTSTTRPTSAGTGTPAATSLITLTDGDTRFGSIGLANTSAISITSSITPQTIRSTALAVGVYYVRMVFSLAGTVNTGTRHGYNFSGTSTIRFFRSRTSSTPYVQVTSTPSFDQGLAEANTSAVIEGIIQVTAAGTFSMQAAQNTSHADTLTVSAANHMLITPCPNGSIS